MVYLWAGAEIFAPRQKISKFGKYFNLIFDMSSSSSSSPGFGVPFSSSSNLLETSWSSSSECRFCYIKCLQSSLSSLSPSASPCKAYTFEEELQAFKILLISYECFKNEESRQQYLNQQVVYHPALEFYRELNRVEAEAFLTELKKKGSSLGIDRQEI